MQKSNIFIVVLFIIFSIYIYHSQLSNEVLEIITPTQIVIDTNKNRVKDNNEIFCVDGVESFSLNPAKEHIDTFNMSNKELIGLGYLAQEYAQKTLQNRNVRIKLTGKTTTDCQFADIKYNGIDYSKSLINSGFGIVDGKIGNQEKFKQNFERVKNLNLVILNHHSNKYHELDCEYGNIAHDTIIIPRKQLPKDAIPCRYCHKINEKLRKSHKSKEKYERDISYTILPQPPLVHTDGNINLYYTDFTKHLKPDNLCNTNECRTFVNLVNSAKETIDIAIYGYEEVPAITSALQQAHDRGVKIRFVYDTDSARGTFYPHNEIIKNLSIISSTDIGKENGYIMHNKFIIFDRQKVFTGSMNFSRTGLSGYDQNDVILINSAEVAALYEKEFEQMINGKFHKSKVSVSENNRFRLGETDLGVYFSPSDKSGRRVIELINGAGNYIYIPTFLITHKDITNALILAKSRGVDVKIIMDANSVNTRNIKYKELRAAGIPLKFENYAGKLHSKTMIIDDCYIIMGSMNFSNSGENKNDENMLVISNRKFASEYKKFFMYLWGLIPDKYLTKTLRSEGVESIGSCSDGVDNNFNGKIDSQDEGCKAAVGK